MTGDLAVSGLVPLLQLADSSFPSGGFAHSHGLEWLVHEGMVTGEASVGRVLQAYLCQVGEGLLLPAALAALRGRSIEATQRADRALDRAIVVPVEREASRAIGERLLTSAAGAFGGPWTIALVGAVRAGTTPGHQGIAFGTITRDFGVPERTALTALAFTIANSLTQAAIRLGVAGQAGAARLLAASTPAIEAAVARTLSRPRRFRPGAFTPGLDIAGLLHPTLPFKVFAS